MKSKSSMILDGLFSSRVNINEGFNPPDVPTVSNRVKLQKQISQSLTQKYSKVFQDFGDVSVEVDIYTNDDDDLLVDDAVSSLNMSLVFETDVSKRIREVFTVIKKFMKNYPDFEYDKRSNVFWFEVDKYEDIIDVFDTIGRTDRVNIRSYYNVIDSSEVESNYERTMSDWKAERNELESYYNSQRL